MDKKIIGAIFCACIFGLASIPVAGETQINDIDKEVKFYIEQILDYENQTLGNYFFLTNGPVLDTYSNVELLSGSESQMEKINQFLNRKMLRPFLYLKSIPVFVENLSFTINYKKDVRTNSRYSFFSGSAIVIWNETSGEFGGIKDINFKTNEPHKVNIENMTGIFIFQRFKLYDRSAPLFRKIFQPAKFMFIGFCENINFLES